MTVVRRRVQTFAPEERDLGDGGFATTGGLPTRSPDPIVDRTDPEPEEDDPTRNEGARDTLRPSQRAETPRQSFSPESGTGAQATPTTASTPTPVSAPDGTPSVFTPLPSANPRSLTQPGTEGVVAGVSATGNQPRTFGTIPGSPVLGVGGGLLGGGLNTPAGSGQGEAEVDDLLAAILALMGGDSI